jgi:rsbT antagonist protein RsbS
MSSLSQKKNQTTQNPATRSRDQIPVIELWGHLLVPLQGDISDSQMRGVVETVLQRIAQRGADGLVIDTSGIWIVDSHLCAGLGKLATCASIMGVPSVLCGLSADVVMTLESMGFELTATQTATTLEHALEKLGIFVERRAVEPAREPGREPAREPGARP